MTKMQHFCIKTIDTHHRFLLKHLSLCWTIRNNVTCSLGHSGPSAGHLGPCSRTKQRNDDDYRDWQVENGLDASRDLRKIKHKWKKERKKKKKEEEEREKIERKKRKIDKKEERKNKRKRGNLPFLQANSDELIYYAFCSKKCLHESNKAY